MLQRTHSPDAIRWLAGERLHHLFEDRVDRLAAEGRSGHAAVVTAAGAISYGALEERANRLARYLRRKGVRAGDRVGLLFDRSPEAYAALLAVSKAGAVYVPLDASFPPGRIAFIVADSGIRMILSVSPLADKLGGLDWRLLLVDVSASEIGEESAERPEPPVLRLAADELCYIIYTSGSTGNPKGVAVDHSSICNFIRVASEVYGVASDDRMYQGLTIAFDFSVEEVWIALNVGATLVPGPSGPSLVGRELAEFLRANEITAFCCVPTLLATVEDELPALRFLLVSGEACPDDLVARWYRKGRRILNAYGPTEATVTATWQELKPGKPVTIGKPLPTYSVIILDPDRDEAVCPGGTGEIGIAGIGLARGYVNRDDLTQARFIPDFTGRPDNPSGRIYRTGDLGRINADGEIEYLGRIDTQVKIRGYRIELTEIESVLLQVPSIAQAVVATHQPDVGAKELVAYYTRKPSAAEIRPPELAAFLRDRLPSYMVPAWYEELAEIPLMPSNKANHRELPPPSGTRLATSRAFEPPSSAREEKLAAIAAEVLQLEQVSVSDDFFLDLGAHSLLMAQFAAEIRTRGIAPSVSMRDIYQYPTVRQLAVVLEAAPSSGMTVAPPPQEQFRLPRVRDYYLCGTLQLLAYALYSSATVAWFVLGLGWAHTPDGVAGPYLRVMVFALATFVVFSGVPILLKWLLVGRWREERIPVWSLRYFRFWVVKQLVQFNPLALFAGTEFYNIYLRLLGARIGRNAVIYARGVPVCTDLVSIGEGTILQKESVLLAYHARGGYICTGPVSIGANAYVGEGSVLDIGTGMGDGAQLGHRSALLPGQRVPEGRSYHGSPAEETQTSFRSVEPMPCGTVRRVLYPTGLLMNSLLLYLPAAVVAGYEVFDASPRAAAISVFPDILLTSLAGYFGLLALGLVLIAVVPRMLNLLLRAEKTYPLYGLHYLLFRYIQILTNSRAYSVLFGDSSYVVHYLRWIGYELNRVEQTGTNFGTFNLHDTPFLCNVGSGTMVSDGLSMMNAHISSSSFRLSKCSIGARNYLGNDVIVPPGARTGDNCLLGTKVMVPIDGPLRENTGLLGSPAFEIPRATNRDTRLAVTREARRAELLRKKNAANLRTMAAHLFFRWAFYFIAAVAFVYIWQGYKSFGMPVLIAASLAFSVFTIAYLVFVERLSLGFKRLEPVTCSIYDPRFWRVEHYWKVSESQLRGMFKGTPFKNLVSRLLGMKVGRMVFDDGAQATERTLVEIGDYCTLNEGTTLQSHSLEEGVFKSDHIRLGPGCTIGARAYVHYGTRIGDHAVVEADSFLMKGEKPTPGSIWGGNPARLM